MYSRRQDLWTQQNISAVWNQIKRFKKNKQTNTITESDLHLRGSGFQTRPPQLLHNVNTEVQAGDFTNTFFLKYREELSIRQRLEREKTNAVTVSV